MIRTPVFTGLLQSDIDFAGFKPLNADLSDYILGGGSGGNPLLTVSVRDAPYNATGDGVTDDSAAIQSAINAVASSGGGTVYFPRGTYLCNGAFDSTTNSILKIPMITTGQPIPITLLGDSPATFPSPYAIGTGGSRIKSTKTGTGSGPAIFASGPYQTPPAMPAIGSFNNTRLTIKDLNFRVNENPTIYGIRCDSQENLTLQCVEVDIDVATVPGDPVTEPSHGTCGITMPFSQSSGFNICDTVYVTGFDVGIRAGENFMMLNGAVGQCHVGVEFVAAYHMSSVIVPQFAHCTHIFNFTGNHTVFIIADIEHAQSGTGRDWALTSADVYDPSNYARGEIKYKITQGGVGDTSAGMTVTGGTNAGFTNLYTGETSITGNGAFYVGTDARLVSVSGGIKLEVRNTSTGTWVEATRYTNP